MPEQKRANAGNNVRPGPLDRLRSHVGKHSVLFARKALGLHAMITSAGAEQVTDPSYDWHGLKRGSHEFVLFQYTLAGLGRLRRGGTDHEATPGTAIVLHFPDDNRYWFDPARADDWRFFYVCMNGSEALRAWRAAVARVGPLIRLADDAPLLRCAAEVCADVVDGRLDTPWRASAAAYTLAMRLLESVVPTGDDHVEGRPDAVAAAIAYVRDHYTESIGVDDLAAVAGFSRFHFSRLFKQSEGLSPGEYIIRHRLREATRLLQTTDLPLKAVAQRCGFADANYFGKAFRKVFGVSPGTLRRGGMY